MDFGETIANPYLLRASHVVLSFICIGVVAVGMVFGRRAISPSQVSASNASPVSNSRNVALAFLALCLLLVVSGLWLRYRVYISPKVWADYNGLLGLKVLLVLGGAFVMFSWLRPSQWINGVGLPTRRGMVALCICIFGAIVISVLLAPVREAELRLIGRERGAGESALRGSLASLRNAIDMYAAEHGGVFPGADGDQNTLTDQLTKKTAIGGATGGSELIYGPYLRQGFPPVPVGPNAGATGVIMTRASPPVVDESKHDGGWVYNYTTGELIANTDDESEDGDRYSNY